jgi:hypothetical protein
LPALLGDDGPRAQVRRRLQARLAPVGEVILWDMRTRKRLYTRPVCDHPVMAVAVSPDSKLLAMATGRFDFLPLGPRPEWEPLRKRPKAEDKDDEKESRILPANREDRWRRALVQASPLGQPSLPTQPTQPIEGPSAASPSQQQASGQIDFIGGGEAALRALPDRILPDSAKVVLWDVGRRKEVASLSVSASVTSIAFDPAGKHLAAACWDGTIKIWLARENRLGLARTLRGHKGPVAAVTYSPDGKTLASAGEDGSVRLWNPASGDELFRLIEHARTVTAVAFHPDGRRLASAGVDGTVMIWNVADGQRLLTIRGHRAAVTGVAFSTDGRVLASTATDGTLCLWGADTVARREEHLDMPEEEMKKGKGEKRP